MATPIENAIKINGVELPTRCDCGNIFVQASDKCNMTRARLCRNSRMGDTKRAMLEYSGAQKRGKRSGGEIFIRLGIWFREGKECLVGAKPVS